MAAALRIAIIGAGLTAANHARVIGESDRAKLEVLIDEDFERAEEIAEATGCVIATELSAVEGCHAAIVTTPPDTHAAVALELIAAGIPVLVETPLSPSIDDARAVVDAAAKANVPLACGFLERFNPAIRTARAMLDEQPRHIVAVRHTPPNVRAAANAVHELMIHDIDLAIQLGGGAVVDSARGWVVTPPESHLIEIADATIAFPNGLVATLSASRVSHRDIRTLMIVTASKMIEVDVLRHQVTVTRHQGHETVFEAGTRVYREQTIVDRPLVRHAGDSLALQLEQFLDLAEGRLDLGAIRNGLLPPHTIADRIANG